MGLTLFVLALSAIVTHAQDASYGKEKKIVFRTYWNVPTIQCARYNLGFEQLAQKYNIVQNLGDQFRGDKIAILYDPGIFPAIVKSRSGGRVVHRNGGVPQEGNLTLHLNAFAKNLDELIPDKNFSGVAIIDFEHWRPIYRQNFGTLVPYKELTIKIERERHPLWTDAQLQEEAQRRFENGSRAFMEETILLAKKLRPNGLWAYYAFPYCYNYKETDCSADVLADNDRLKWLFTASDNLQPSLYLYNEKHPHNMASITGRVREANRVLSTLSGGKKRGVLPYFTLMYDNGQFLAKDEITSSVNLLKDLQVDGLVIWGSSNHVNTKAKCEDLYKYVDTVFGPVLNP